MKRTAKSGNRSSTVSTSKTAPIIWTSVVLFQTRNMSEPAPGRIPGGCHTSRAMAEISGRAVDSRGHSDLTGIYRLPSHPFHQAQKMLILTGKGGEGKSRIGLLLKKLLGPAAHMEAVLRLETNRFASANLEHKLVMIDDDLNMTALPETRNIKSIVTAEDRICVERKGKQATQGLLYARLLCFGNGNLVAAHDTSDGFWRRQILISVKDKPEGRTDDPYLIDKLSEELPCILLWALEGLKRLLANQYRFTLSERARQNLAAAMEDGCHLDQFMQASSYVRFDPEKSARSTYLFRAYNKWCSDNLEKPAMQKKFSQYLFKNADRYGIRFSKHIEAATGAIGACMSALIAPSNKIGAGSENFPPHAPPRPASRKQDDYSFYFLDSIYYRSAPPAHEPPKRARPGQEGGWGAYFCIPHRKNLEAGSGAKQGRPPHSTLGALQAESPHEPGGGPEQEVLLKNFQTSDSSPSKALNNTPETGTIEVSKTSAAEPQARPQAARLEPLVYGWRRSPNCWPSPPVPPTICATAPEISGCCASAPASG